MLKRCVSDLLLQQISQRPDNHQERFDPPFNHCGERAFQVFRTSKIGDLERQTDVSRGSLKLGEADLRRYLPKHAHSRKVWDYLPQQAEVLSPEFRACVSG